MKFTKDHEYIKPDGTVGITHHAQELLGDIVFVELPEIGRTVKAGDAIAVVESVKAASEVYAPVSGEIIAVNENLNSNPALVNESPETDAWFFKLKIANDAEVGALMDEDEYKKMIN